MTMASVRFQEAWAMAIWLSKVGEYEITDGEVNETVAAALPPEEQEKLEAEIEEKKRVLTSTSKLKAKIEERTGVSAPAPVVEVKEKKGKAAKEEIAV